MSAAAPLLAAAAFALIAAPAFAHPPPFGIAGFFGGLIHPAFVPAHLIAALGLGVLVGQQAPRWGRTAPATFILALTAGLAMLRLGAAPNWTLEAVLLAGAAAGALAAWARALPEMTGGALAAATGFAIGLDSPPEALSLREADLMLIGTAFGGSLLLVIVTEIAKRLTRPWQRIGMRILGSWLAASAVLTLAVLLGR